MLLPYEEFERKGGMVILKILRKEQRYMDKRDCESLVSVRLERAKELYLEAKNW